MREVERIGFIGLGVMGGRMCRNIVRKSGKDVIYYDLSPERLACSARSRR